MAKYGDPFLFFETKNRNGSPNKLSLYTIDLTEKIYRPWWPSSTTRLLRSLHSLRLLRFARNDRKSSSQGQKKGALCHVAPHRSSRGGPKGPTKRSHPSLRLRLLRSLAMTGQGWILRSPRALRMTKIRTPLALFHLERNDVPLALAELNPYKPDLPTRPLILLPVALLF